MLVKLSYVGNFIVNNINHDCIFIKFQNIFDAKNVEFTPVGSTRYGLRSDKLKSSDIAKYYRSPYRNIIIDPTSGQMWESDNSPMVEGIPGCKKVRCPPLYNHYDPLDICWQCGTAYPDKMVIPDIHPHVKN